MLLPSTKLRLVAVGRESDREQSVKVKRVPSPCPVIPGLTRNPVVHRLIPAFAGIACPGLDPGKNGSIIFNVPTC